MPTFAVIECKASVFYQCYEYVCACAYVRVCMCGLCSCASGVAAFLTCLCQHPPLYNVRPLRVRVFVRAFFL